MSSSAFTPTTTQVTTEVPVNVPVVTAWQSYTPTFDGFGTPTAVSALWRRIGDSIEVSCNFTSGTPTSAVATVSLPSGLNLDASKINGPGQSKILGIAMRANSVSTPFPASTRGPWIVTDSKIVSTSKIYFTFLANTASASVFEVATGSSMISSGEQLTLEFRAPISQWSSGVTTLADRALEEYAWNSDDGAGSNSFSFGYGPGGVLFPAINSTGATVTKRVRFNTEILSTDSITVEYQQSSTGPWRDAAQRFTNTQAGAAVYGLQITNVSSTDVDVQFGISGATQTGATFGSAGELWNAYRSANWKWRVRKVSSGAQVGYPISTKNIVGATDGVAPVTGMLGEKIDLTARAVTTASAQWRANTTPLATLSSGIYLIYGVAGLPGGSGSASVSVMSTNNNNDGTGFISNYTTSNYQSSAAGGAVPMITAHLVVPSGTTQAIYAKAYGDVSTPVVTISGFAVRIA
jgi:hypothetical protein